MPWFEKGVNKVNKTSLERPLSIERCTVVKRLVIPFIVNSLQNSSLNLTDLETQIKALRLSWIPRVLDERFGPWKAFHLEKYGGTLLLKTNYDVRDLNVHLNVFYQQLLI